MKTIASHIGLRGVAASAVTLGHFTEIFAPDYFPPHTHVAVDFFFLLSGFILAHVYVTQFAAGLRLRDLGCFLIRRLARIYPLHLATLLAILLILRFRMSPEESAQLIPYLTLTHAWGGFDLYQFNAPSWSISVEFGAYLAFPLLALLLARRGGWLALLAISAAGLVALWPFGAGSLDLHVMGSRHAWLRGVVAFPLGMVLAQLAQNRPPQASSAGVLQLLALAGFAAVIVLGAPEALLLAPMALMVWATATDEGLVAKVMASRVMVWLGDISYGMYLIQWVVILVLYNVIPKLGFLSPGGLQMAIGGLFVLGVVGGAALSARWFEPVFTRWARACRLSRS